MKTIVLADDHQLMREGLSSMLNEQANLKVIGEASNGEDAIKLVHQLCPDVVIVDIMMPGINGIEVARQISSRCKTIILSMYSADEYVREVFHVGAMAYVLKKDSFEDLVNAIREVLAGRIFISPGLARQAVATHFQLNMDMNHSHASLTKRERQILPLIASGETSLEIGEKLFISKRTVEYHLSNIMRKLNLRNQKEVVRYCIEMGITPSTLPNDQS